MCFDSASNLNMEWNSVGAVYRAEEKESEQHRRAEEKRRRKKRKEREQVNLCAHMTERETKKEKGEEERSDLKILNCRNWYLLNRIHSNMILSHLVCSVHGTRKMHLCIWYACCVCACLHVEIAREWDILWLHFLKSSSTTTATKTAQQRYTLYSVYCSATTIKNDSRCPNGCSAVSSHMCACVCVSSCFHLDRMYESVCSVSFWLIVHS